LAKEDDRSIADLDREADARKIIAVIGWDEAYKRLAQGARAPLPAARLDTTGMASDYDPSDPGRRGHTHGA
jgi:hypothetical protein